MHPTAAHRHRRSPEPPRCGFAGNGRPAETCEAPADAHRRRCDQLWRIRQDCRSRQKRRPARAPAAATAPPTRRRWPARTRGRASGPGSPAWAPRRPRRSPPEHCRPGTDHRRSMPTTRRTHRRARRRPRRQPRPHAPPQRRPLTTVPQPQTTTAANAAAGLASRRQGGPPETYTGFKNHSPAWTGASAKEIVVCGERVDRLGSPPEAPRPRRLRRTVRRGAYFLTSTVPGTGT